LIFNIVRKQSYKKIGSPATLQRRLVKLVQMDFIRYRSDVDGRKKYLELTPKAIDYIAKLGQCITAAASKALA
jgi:DNA-binding MarR family transcriptional regulator